MDAVCRIPVLGRKNILDLQSSWIQYCLDSCSVSMNLHTSYWRLRVSLVGVALWFNFNYLSFFCEGSGSTRVSCAIWGPPPDKEEMTRPDINQGKWRRLTHQNARLALKPQSKSQLNSTSGLVHLLYKYLIYVWFLSVSLTSKRFNKPNKSA